MHRNATLEIVSVRNVSHPPSQQAIGDKRKVAMRTLFLVCSDVSASGGTKTVEAIEFKPIEWLYEGVPAGRRITLRGARFHNGMALLTPDTVVDGGGGDVLAEEARSTNRCVSRRVPTSPAVYNPGEDIDPLMFPTIFG